MSSSGTGLTAQTPLGTTSTTGQLAVDQQRNWLLASISQALAVWVNGGTINGNLVVTGTITPNSVKGIVGTTTNDNAQGGSIGEYIEAHVVSGSAVSLTTGTGTNVTSIALSAGDWDVSGVVEYTGGAGTTATRTVSGVGSTSTSFSAPGLCGRTDIASRVAGDFAMNFSAVIGPARFSLATPTTIYLVALADFAVSTAAAYGQIRARRVR